MDIKDQVCSYELAKRLKVLGVKQESLFYYDYAPHIHGKNLDEPILDVWKVIPWKDPFNNRKDEESFISAFTVAELGEMLHAFEIENYNTADYYNIVFNVSDINIQTHYEKDIKEANARAKMLIYLIENKLISNED